MADDDDEFDWGVLGGIEKTEEVKATRNLSEPVMFAFGFGEDGVLGLGDEKNRFLATGGDFRLQQIAAGAKHSIALTEDGLVYVWGLGTDGQLGLAPPPYESLQLSYADKTEGKTLKDFEQDKLGFQGSDD